MLPHGGEEVVNSSRRTEGLSLNEGRRRRPAKVVGQLALQTTVLAVVFTTTSLAEHASTAAVSKHDLQAKIDYCETCHGVSGRGFHGYYPIPRLAGQQTGYFENQLQAFVEHRRTNIIMFDVAHVLSPEMITALATNFGALDPPPLGGAPKELAGRGRKIYEDGIPDSNVPPCATCHGPQAKGNGEFPRLAGQVYDYIVKKLTNWTKERGQNPEKPDTSAIMQPIAHALTEPEIKAVAAYVSYLE
jgi:cytochrome c553